MRIIDNFLRYKVHSLRHVYVFNFYLSKIKYKRPEVNTEPTHFLTHMNNGKTFSSLNGMACSYQCYDQFQFLPGSWQAKRYWISWDLKRPILFKNNLNDTTNNMKSQIHNKKKWNCGITNTNIKKNISNQGTYFLVIMNNHLKIISVHGALL